MLRVALVTLLLGCTSPPADLDAGPAVCSPAPADRVDVLFVVETGGYVQELQLAAANELASWMGALLGAGVTSIQAGMVTTDMGTMGVTFPTCLEPVLGDDGLLRTQPTPWTGIEGPLPAVHVVTNETELDDAMATLRLAIETGNDAGCGLEQPLEAMPKALSPAAPTSWTREGYVAPSFFMGEGHGDDANAGLVRDESVLVVVILSSEDDASARDPSFFTEGNNQITVYTRPDLLHPPERYVDGLLSLRRDPARLVVVEIAGFPRGLTDPAGTDIEALLADPRMAAEMDPSSNRVVPACVGPGPVPHGFPGRRLATVADGLRRAGAHALLSSVCEYEYAAVFEAMVEAIDRARIGTPCRDR